MEPSSSQGRTRKGVGFQETAADAIQVDVDQSKTDLHKKRPSSPDHLGQIWWRNLQLQKKAPTRRFGWERLGHISSVGIPFKCEELQGRHPFDFIKETEAHFRQPPRPRENSKHVRIQDSTLMHRRQWIEPLRKGQPYYDYCRDKWMSKISQFGSAVAPAASFYSLWSVTDLVLQNGGVAFMIVYFVITILFTVPLTYIELALGQFNRSGPVKTMKQVCPLLPGLGYLMLILCFMDYFMSLTHLSWLVFYVTSSFLRTELPWGTCGNPWNSLRCHETNGTYYKQGEHTSSVEEFRYNILRYTNTEKNESKMNLDGRTYSRDPNIAVILCFLFMLICFHFITRLNCRKLGKLMYFTFKFALFLIILSYVIRSSIGERARDRLIYQSFYSWFFHWDNWICLADPNVWVGSFKHALLTSGVGTGIHITFGSHNSFTNHKIKYHAVVNGLTSYFLHSSVAVFFILCHFSVRTTPSFQNNPIAYGNDTIFEIFPQVLAELGGNRWYVWILFLGVAGGIILFSVLRSICSLHTIKQHFCDKMKPYYEPQQAYFSVWENRQALRQKRVTYSLMSSNRKAILMAAILILIGLLQLFTFFPIVLVYFASLESIWYKYVLPMSVMVECLVIFFILGTRTLDNFIRKMTKSHATLWYRFVWKSFTPAFTVIYFVNFLPWISLPDKLTDDDFIILYILFGIPFLWLITQIHYVSRRAVCKSFNESLLLKATPEHQHEDVILGKRPLVRFYWMHQISVPKGVGYSKFQRKFPFVAENKILSLTTMIISKYWEVLMWDLFWNKIGFRVFNRVHCCSMKSAKGSPRKKKDKILFPVTALRLKEEHSKEKDPAEMVPNKQISNVLKMKIKAQTATAQRNQWMKEKQNSNAEIEPHYSSKLESPQSRNNRDSQPTNKASVTKKTEQIKVAETQAESSVSEDLAAEDISTSENEKDLAGESETSQYEESWDDDESLDWADSLGTGTGKGREKHVETSREAFFRIKHEHVDESHYLDRRKLWSNKETAVANYTIDELMEFDEVMESRKKRRKLRKRKRQHQDKIESDSGDDRMTKFQKKLQQKWRRQKRIEGIDADFMSEDDGESSYLTALNTDGNKDKTVGSDKEKGSGQGDLEDDYFSSSSGSGVSSWSSRSSSAPSLEEQPDVIVTTTEKKIRGSGATTTSKKSKRPLGQALSKHSMAPSRRKSLKKIKKKSDKPLLPAESSHGPFRQKGASKSSGKQLFGDMRSHLHNFLSVNITSRHRHKGKVSKTPDSDSE